MEYSSGIILYKFDGEQTTFFMCTPDGPFWKKKEFWSFPKGHIENGETPFKAALREFKEETNIDITNSSSAYKYHGTVKQNNYKIVHVFSKPYDGEDTTNCYSNETYTEIKGIKIIHKEIKDYKWMTLSEINDKGAKCYIPILENIINGD